MYWMKNDEGTYEVLDGQQRTISIGQYVNGDFSLEDQYFHNLTEEDKNQILDYELMIYFCEGTDKERLDWFKIINIAGEKLTDQEIRNAVYTGPWLSDAKLKFSKSNCVASLLANDGGALVNGSPIRQEIFETALFWITNTMGQFALLSAPSCILLVIQMLSGGMTPMEGEPVWMQYLMRKELLHAAFC